MQVPFRTPVVIDTPVPIGDVRARLRNAVVSIFAIYSEFPVTGSVGEQSCILRYRISYRNSFQRRLRLKFEPSVSGTRLTGYFELSMCVLIFTTSWLAVAGLLFLASLAALLSGGLLNEASRRYAQLPMAGGSLAIFALGLAILRIGVWLSESSEKKLMMFLVELLNATPSR